MTETGVVAVPDLESIELAADPGSYAIAAVERAKVWLANALEHGAIEQIIEVKAQAEAMRIYTMQKQLGKDAELSAAEIVRRAERGIGLAIRKGQEAGTIRRPREPINRANGTGVVLREKNTKMSPAEFFSGGADSHETYLMTDEVSEEQFDAAIDAAKTEKNLSRKNVVRKVRAKRGADEVKAAALQSNNDASLIPDARDSSPQAVAMRKKLIKDLSDSGLSSRQIADRIKVSDETVRRIARREGISIVADEVMGRGNMAVDSNRIIRETIATFEGLDMALKLVNYDELERDEIENWTDSLTESIRILNRLNKKLKEMVQ